ncbi:MAG TPA: divalent-cation tolerance protein CutA [Acidobacteriaceae bacterium]|nr:divalent-cation tolerance protein CutA [Acidobacteriaceae bacterium]
MPVPASEARIVLTTVGSRDEAEEISRSLVDDRLAACVNIVPGLASIYRWKGEVETASEFLLIIKTAAANLDHLETALRRLHSYEVSEFLVLTPECASKPYLDWLLLETSSRR